MIYFRCYIEAYDDATADLSPLEDGTYFRLLRHYYRTEKPLPIDTDKLARICKAISLEERAAIDAVLDRFFIQQAGVWHNERADHEIAVSKTARANGSRGGRPSEETESETGSQTGGVTGSETGSVTGDGTGELTGSGQPSSLSTKTIPSTPQPPNQPPSADAPRRARRPAVDTGAIWEAYSQAYRQRYRGETPVRNARVNGQLADVVRQLGVEEAPAVAEFYVRHNRAEYVKALHSTGWLVKDAVSLRTQWAMGRKVSDTEARQADRTMATGNAFAPLIDEARALG